MRNTSASGNRVVLPAAFAVALLFYGATIAPAQLIEELRGRASWQPPAPQEVKQELWQWLQTQEPDAATRERIDAVWAGDALHPQQLLEQLVATVALLDDDARQLVDLLAGSQPPSASLPAWLDGHPLPAVVRNNLRLVYGRWLAQQAYYDEALEQLGGLEVADVVDPASLLFYQSVVQHRLLHQQECLETITRLLEREQEIPLRYASVARLMEADIRPLEEDSLDEVSRLMQDIQRRLFFGRAGTRVRQQEDDVIAKLDKMIDQLEQQQQQQQGGGSAQGSIRSNNPAEDSLPLGGRGPGDVDQRRIGNSSGWGNLPPKQRQEALQQISKDLPAHYREVIEEYFRRLARDEGS